MGVMVCMDWTVSKLCIIWVPRDRPRGGHPVVSNAPCAVPVPGELVLVR